LPDAGQMLFDRRLGHHDAELLDVGSHGRWPDSKTFEKHTAPDGFSKRYQ
jgi:hypothetical protein